MAARSRRRFDSKMKKKDPLRTLDKIETRRAAPGAFIMFAVVFLFAAAVVFLWFMLFVKGK